MIFRPRQKKIHCHPQISIFENETNGSVKLKCKNYIKYLGVLIDENLSWKNRKDFVISKTMGMIAKLRHFIRWSVLIYMYKFIIVPYLTYGLHT